MRTYIVTPNPHLLAFNAALATMPADRRLALTQACEVPSAKLAETLCRWFVETDGAGTETPVAYIRWVMSAYTDPVLASKKDFSRHV